MKYKKMNLEIKDSEFTELEMNTETNHTLAMSKYVEEE